MTLGITSVKAGFYSWIDEVLARPVPCSTEAFHFNLYEGSDSVHVQLVGADTFAPGENPSTDYWPGAETFSTGEDIFEIPFSVAGNDWSEWLQTVVDLVTSYLAEGAGSEVLRSKSGVGLGFVDGDMHVVWQRDAAAQLGVQADR